METDDEEESETLALEDATNVEYPVDGDRLVSRRMNKCGEITFFILGAMFIARFVVW